MYIDRILNRFDMQNSKRGFLPMSHGVHLSKTICPRTQAEKDKMDKVPYASAIGSIMYAMICTRLDISYAVNMTIELRLVQVRITGLQLRPFSNT